jgi:mono/diheme cytochrome c family protein
MIARLLFVVTLLVATLPAVAAEGALDGEQIFKAKCQACHTLSMAQALLAPKPEEDRPAHLTTFLKTHPDRLTDVEVEAVIAFLSRKP